MEGAPGVYYPITVGKTLHALHDVVDIAFRKLCALGDFLHDFAVVVRVAQLFCEPFAEFASSASEFSAYGNDLIHGYASV